MTNAISILNLTKDFNAIYSRPKNLKSLLAFSDSSQPNKQERHYEKRRVLDSVSFLIPKGEFVGLMGRNGVGKSTLLKLICGIYKPTSGTISVDGIIAPMIEVGAGFHEELSGYENIFLNASVLGFGKKATESIVSKIIDFSELGDQIFLPVKHYSSGMLVRLGFSVATQLPADIILVDEVLAVGDSGFQKKSLSRIHELHRMGTTIVLVSHNVDTVRKNCERVIVFDSGHIVYDGLAEEGTQQYEGLF